MARRAFAALGALLYVLASVTGCGRQEDKIDTTPLPRGNVFPRVCDDRISEVAVQRMTGRQELRELYLFDLHALDEYGVGWCRLYEPDGERRKLLEIVLTPEGVPAHVAEKLRSGARRLPPILPGAEGYYAATRADGHPGAVAMLRRGRSTLIVNLERGAKGRDHEADVVSLMKLIADIFISDASAPPASQPTKKQGT